MTEIAQLKDQNQTLECEALNNADQCQYLTHLLEQVTNELIEIRQENELLVKYNDNLA